MNKSIEEDKINLFFIECFNNILREEENKLKIISDNSLSVSEFHIIETINNYNNSSGKVIAKKLGVTPGTLTVAVNTLEKKGYVTKTKDETDKRITRLSLTPLGISVNEKHEVFHENMVKGIVNVCNKRELIILTKALEKINKYFMEQHNESKNNNR